MLIVKIKTDDHFRLFYFNNNYVLDPSPTIKNITNLTLKFDKQIETFIFKTYKRLAKCISV